MQCVILIADFSLSDSEMDSDWSEMNRNKIIIEHFLTSFYLIQHSLPQLRILAQKLIHFLDVKFPQRLIMFPLLDITLRFAYAIIQALVGIHQSFHGQLEREIRKKKALFVFILFVGLGLKEIGFLEDLRKTDQIGD